MRAGQHAAALKAQRQIVRGLVCCLLGLAVVGCTSTAPKADPPTSRSESPQLPAPITTTTSTSGQPIGTTPTSTTLQGAAPRVVLDIAPDDEALLVWAEQVLIRDCMAAAGFEYFVPDRSTYARDPAEHAYFELERFPYDASVEGVPYAPRVRSTDQAPDPNRTYVLGLSPAAQAAYSEAVASGEMTAPVLGMQMPSQGCSAEARRQLYGDLETFMVSGFVVNLDSTTRFAAETDDRVVTAMADWSACMTESGFTFESFYEARNAAAGSQASQAVAIAAADADCTTKSGLGVVFHTAYDEHFNELLDENADLLNQYVAARATAIEKATSLLAAS